MNTATLSALSLEELEQVAAGKHPKVGIIVDDGAPIDSGPVPFGQPDGLDGWRQK